MGLNFDLQNTTRVLFGQGRIADLRHLVNPKDKILVLFGGGSIKANGVYAEVMNALNRHDVTPFGGIEPNPEYDTIMEACTLAREKNITFVLGVGGGSVIDALKFLAAAIPSEQSDAWDALLSSKTQQSPLPNGAVLTLPATGSESNPVSVISRRDRGLKLPFTIEGARPRFAILDPSTMKSLSRRQLENGVVDAVTHVIEQYITQPANLPVQYGLSETLLSVLFDAGPQLIENPTDDLRDTVMWAANQALNGVIGAGARQDWSTHMIGHAITALYGIDHARTLTLIMPHLLRDQCEIKVDMLARFGRRVWKLQDDDHHAVAMESIALTEQFFRRMGCPTRFSDLPEVAFNASHIVYHLERAGQLPIGENHQLKAEDVRRILQAAA